MVRFKIGKLTQGLFLIPGDTLNLTYTEIYDDVVSERLLHSEQITKECVYTCFAVLDLPVGMGMVLGENETALRAFLEQTWPGCEVPANKGIL